MGFYSAVVVLIAVCTVVHGQNTTSNVKSAYARVGAAPAQGSCHVGWKEIDGSCYSVSDESKNWFEAATICRILNSTLAQVDSLKISDNIIILMAAKQESAVWIGGSSRYHAKKWEWVPSLDTFHAFSNWYEGQPDNPESDRCLEVRNNYNYMWGSSNCLNSNKFVCQKKLIQK